MNANQPPVVIFGCRSLASLLWHCMKYDAGREVAAFTVDVLPQGGTTHEGLPLVPFGEIADRYPPHEYEMLIPIDYSEINGLRRTRCDLAIQLGYHLTSYVSSCAVVPGDVIISDNCMLFEQAILQPFARLGKNTIIRAGANIGHHSVVGDHCFISSGVVTGGKVQIGEQCYIGLGAILRDNIRIAQRCLIGAGAVVIADTEPDGVYVGNPARRLEKTSMEATRAK
jgi:sugar O-acyltransferase (sialic acid O-acetyltransferase NeuD family)